MMGFARVLYVRDLCTELKNPWRAVLSALASHENEKDDCRCDPSFGQLAEDTGIRRQSLGALINDLERDGYIRIDRYVRAPGTPRRSNGYQFTLSIEDCYARLVAFYDRKRADRIGPTIGPPVGPIVENDWSTSRTNIGPQNGNIGPPVRTTKLKVLKGGVSYEKPSELSTIAPAEDRTNAPGVEESISDPGPEPEGIGWTQAGTPFARDFRNTALQEWCVQWMAWHETRRRNGH